jgi:hypothetical protein
MIASHFANAKGGASAAFSIFGGSLGKVLTCPRRYGIVPATFTNLAGPQSLHQHSREPADRRIAD